MPKKVVHRYPGNFETIVLEKLMDFSENIKGLEKKTEFLTGEITGLVGETEGLTEKTEGLAGEMRQVRVQLADMTERLNEVESRGKKTYDMVVELVGDARVDGEERLFLTRRVRNHDERLEVVESALSIKPSAGAF